MSNQKNIQWDYASRRVQKKCNWYYISKTKGSWGLTPVTEILARRQSLIGQFLRASDSHHKTKHGWIAISRYTPHLVLHR